LPTSPGSQCPFFRSSHGCTIVAHVSTLIVSFLSFSPRVAPTGDDPNHITPPPPLSLPPHRCQSEFPAQSVCLAGMAAPPPPFGTTSRGSRHPYHGIKLGMLALGGRVGRLVMGSGSRSSLETAAAAPLVSHTRRWHLYHRGGRSVAKAVRGGSFLIQIQRSPRQ
jgi:hypothetical protein